MPTIVVLFKLKPGVEVARYEAWARDTDLPRVRAMGSVAGFQILKVAGLFGGGEAPYDYVEFVEVRDLRAFTEELGAEAIARVAVEFQSFADQPQFLLADAL
jgi:REDY-like protein HapK